MVLLSDKLDTAKELLSAQLVREAEEGGRPLYAHSNTLQREVDRLEGENIWVVHHATPSI